MKKIIKEAILSVYYSFIEIISIPFYIFKIPTFDNNFDYEVYWKNREAKDEIHSRFHVIKKIIGREKKIAEIGCGNGFLLEFLRESCDAQCQGYDISEKAINITKSRNIEAEVLDLNTDTFNIGNKYDYIILSEVIEHLPKPEDVILKLQNHCKNGLIISIPNTGYIRDRFRLFFGLFPLQWAFHPSEHLRFWTIRDFKWWVKSLDLQLIGTYPANGITVLNLYKIWPNLFARNVVYLLKNKS